MGRLSYWMSDRVMFTIIVLLMGFAVAVAWWRRERMRVLRSRKWAAKGRNSTPTPPGPSAPPAHL